MGTEKRGSDGDSSSLSSSEYSSEEESRRRRRRKEEKKRKHKSRRRKHASSEDESDDDRKKRRHDHDGEEKRRKKKKRKHYSSEEDSDSEDSHERKKRKREKRKKRRHHSSDEDSESESERRKKKRLLKEAKKILKEHEAAGKSSEDQGAGDKRNVKVISEDDYYLKNNEFATWLKETKGIYFSDMTAEDARKQFASFVDVWNSGKLADKYYQGIKTGQRSSHKWNFEENYVDEEEERLQKRKRDKAEHKKFQKEHELVMDELLPKATGKERLLEKKTIQREKNRNRDLSPEPMKESDIMGGGDDYKSMLARERARREKRAKGKGEALQKKLSVVEEKETAAMDQFRALVNSAGGKITIPKRE